MVVRDSHLNADVRQLELDVVRRELPLVERGGSKAAKAVASHLSLVAESFERLQDRVVLIGFFRSRSPGKDNSTGDHLKRAKHLHGLRRQRHDVQPLHLHAFRGGPPFRSLEVDLAPLGLYQLRSTHDVSASSFIARRVSCEPPYASIFRRSWGNSLSSMRAWFPEVRCGSTSEGLNSEAGLRFHSPRVIAYRKTWLQEFRTRRATSVTPRPRTRSIMATTCLGSIWSTGL